jgi:phosphatidylserine/phosphatidylglycerophosphate/cardiolipin synthase-like enzyme
VRSRISISIVSLVISLVLNQFAWSADKFSYDYNQMFDYARQILTRAPAREFLRSALSDDLTIDPDLAKELGFKNGKLKDISEAQLMLLLQQNPESFTELATYLKEIPANLEGTPTEKVSREKWRKRFRDLLKNPDTLKEFRRLNNPLEAMVLENSDKSPGYSDLKIFFNHPRVVDGVTRPADNLKQTWIDFIRSSKKQYVSNVFDFDLEEVADELIAAAKRGVDVTQGIDKKSVADVRPEVAAIAKKLESGGVKVHLVDSVGLNHQKVAARDWDFKGEGAALFSSGNLTQSCIGPEGDLKNYPKIQSKYSVPNANHMITMRSDIAASLINHELTKTLRPPYLLRGSEYPLAGAYKISGLPFNAAKEKSPYIVIAFTPGGGLGDISQTVISRMIHDTQGPVDMLQFAFSSEKVENALYDRMLREVSTTGKFDFRSVGDGPFAMQYWSRFLSMSGFQLTGDGKVKSYAEIPDSRWKTAMGDQFEKLQNSIRMPPSIYGNHVVEVDGEKLKVSSKIHHKVLVSGRAVSAGTSFNYSAAAQSNQEQFVVVVDQGIADEMRGATTYLYQNSPRSVAQEAVLRNQRKDFEPDVEADATSKTTNHRAMAIKPGDCMAKDVSQRLGL